MREAIGKVGGAAYDFGQSFALYPTSGTSDDYAYAGTSSMARGGKILSYTIECGRSFQPTWQDAQDVIREVDAGLIAFCLAARARISAPAGPVA